MARTVPAVMLRRTNAAGLVASAVAAADGFCTAEPRDDPFAKAPLVHVLFVLAQSRSRLTGLSFFCKLFEEGKNKEALVPSLLYIKQARSSTQLLHVTPSASTQAPAQVAVTLGRYTRAPRSG